MNKGIVEKKKKKTISQEEVDNVMNFIQGNAEAYKEMDEILNRRLIYWKDIEKIYKKYSEVQDVQTS